MGKFFNGQFDNGKFFGPEGFSSCPQTSFFGGSFYCGNFFDDSAPTPPEDAVKTGGGGLDPGEGLKRRRIVKPTGILHLPKKKNGNAQVEARLQEAKAEQAEIAARLAREFTDENTVIREMTVAEVSAEIAILLRKKLRTEDEEAMLLLMMAAVIA